jgi:hypothetical protein
VLKAPSVYIKKFWLFMVLKVLAAGALIVFLLKYRTQVEGTMHTALRSLLKH